MPELPTFDSPKASEGLRVSDLGVSGYEEAARTFARVGHQLGDVAAGVINNIEEGEQREDAVDFTNKSTDFNIKKEQEATDWINSGGSAADFITQKYEPDQQALLDGMRTDKGRAAAEMALAEQRRAFASKIFTDQANRDSVQGQIALEQSGNTYAAQAFGNPSGVKNYADAWQHSAAFMAAAANIKNAGDLQKMLYQGGQHIYDQAAEGLIHQFQLLQNPTQEDHDKVAAILNSDDYTKFLGAKQSEYIKKLDSAANTASDVQGAIAAQAIPSLIDEIKRGDLSRVDQTKALIEGDHHGSDDAVAIRAAERTRQLTDAVAEGNVVTKIAGLPDSVIQNNLPQLTAGIYQSSDPEAPRKALTAAETFIKQRAEGIKTDGAQYFLNNPSLYGSIATRFQQYVQDVSDNKDQQTIARDFQAYALTVSATENAINPGAPPRILPKATYNSVVNTIQGAPENPEGAASVSQTLASLQALVGPQNWNGVAHELSANGVIKPAMFAAAQLAGDPKTWALGQEIIRASMTPNDQLTAFSGKPREYADKIAANALQTLAPTFAETTNGHELINAYVRAISDTLRARGGNAVTQDQANALAQQMVLGRFNIRNNLRIPTKFDDADVADGTDRTLATIDKRDLVPPPSFSGLGKEQQTSFYKDDVKDYGSWITNQAGDGALLRYQGAPVYEKKLVNGKVQTVPVEVKFADMEALGRGIRGPLNQAERFFTNPGSLPGSPGPATLPDIPHPPPAR